MTQTITLTELLAAAEWAGLHALRMPLGGNTVGITWNYQGAPVLVTLDEATESGTVWSVAAARRGGVLDVAGPFPVTSDADQTLADVCAWVARPAENNPDDFEHPVLSEDGITWREREEEPQDYEPAEELVTLTVTRAQYVTLRSAVQDAYDYRIGESDEADELEPYDAAAVAALDALPDLNLFSTDAAYNITQEV